MKNLLHAARPLLSDFLPTIAFAVLVALHVDPRYAVGGALAFALVQIAVQRLRGLPIPLLQWASVALVIVFGSVSLVTNDPRFLMIKPSIIYVAVGVVMLKPGWMNRYLPERAIRIVPDIGYAFGFVWAGLMFLSALVNVVVAMNFSFLTWTAFMSAYATSTKLGLFLVQYATMRLIGRRRLLADPQLLPAAA